MPTSDQVNSTAQDLITTGLAQWDALQNGVLTQEANNPTQYFPRRPWIDEPDGSVPFDEQRGVDLTNPAPAPAQNVLDFIVPNGMDGVIKWISNNTTFPFNDYSGDLLWQILVDGKAVRNFDNILGQKGTKELPRPISPIRLYSGNHVQFTVQHLANPALNGQVTCSLGGYYYPSQGVS